MKPAAHHRSLLLIAACLALCACTRPPMPAGSAGQAGALPDSAASSPLAARYRDAERDLRAEIGDAAAETAADCVAEPVGHRPCGGPSGYVVYSKRTGNEIRILGLAETTRDLGRQIDEGSGLMSTCEMRIPPAVALRKGRCVAADAGTR